MDPELDNADSPLSTTGNILGILTFAYAIIASCLVFLAVIRTADSEMQQLFSQIRQTSRHIETLGSYFRELDLVADIDLAPMRGPIKVALKDWRKTNQGLAARVGKLSEMGPGIKRRIMWWYGQNEMLASMAKLRSEKDDFSALLLTYLSRKISTQEHHLWRLERLATGEPRDSSVDGGTNL
ncbi:hypothetical protein B0H67DRAFT_650545 [Lasiosphaeris hirsuta]|uniref:Uncharacterized protein n=1 Tax=Lasiosphaeris hirsuta TaxID=260670 RepID=A0AA39ZPK9_9PEZI|nr:hypothetical protein B0H67DRAFT_650545 [Lasiosphaeris hirsuta]